MKSSKYDVEDYFILTDDGWACSLCGSLPGERNNRHSMHHLREAHGFIFKFVGNFDNYMIHTYQRVIR